VITKRKDGTWWLGSDLGPETDGLERQITEAEAQKIIAEYKANDERRLENIERAKAPEYAI
jgi:hypothetical protein